MVKVSDRGKGITINIGDISALHCQWATLQSQSDMFQASMPGLQAFCGVPAQPAFQGPPSHTVILGVIALSASETSAAQAFIMHSRLGAMPALGVAEPGNPAPQLATGAGPSADPPAFAWGCLSSPAPSSST